MHQPLETYLRRVKARLKHLPAHEQQQHVQEIEQHLQHLITDNRAAGLPEEEAVAAALGQFGHPSRIGRDLEQARFGTRTGLVKGFLMGAVLGVLLLAVLLAGAAVTGSALGNWAQYLVTIALSGGVASFAGRRFTRRYLTRPARVLPIFTEASHSLAVGVRFMGVGALRGAVGGIVFGALNAILMLRAPYPPPGDIKAALPLLTLVCAIDGALLIGFLSALLGFVLGAFERRTAKRQSA